MTRLVVAFVVACVVSDFSALVVADEEVANRPVVRSSEEGAVYAKSVPDAGYGQTGTTTVFSVAGDRDTPICQYDWYANEFYIGGEGTVVRFGPWHRGFEPQDSHLAVGIYRNGKVIREYTTLEMHKLGSGISTSKSHYTIFKRRLGFRCLTRNAFVYEIEGISGKVISLHLDTGEITEKATEQGTEADVRKSLEIVKSARLQDPDELLKQWQHLPDQLRKELYVGGPLGLSAQGQIQLIGVYNRWEVGGGKNQPKRFFHLRQTDTFGGSLLWSILVNAEDETYRILFHHAKIGDSDGSWLKLQGG